MLNLTEQRYCVVSRDGTEYLTAQGKFVPTSSFFYDVQPPAVAGSRTVAVALRASCLHKDVTIITLAELAEAAVKAAIEHGVLSGVLNGGMLSREECFTAVCQWLHWDTIPLFQFGFNGEQEGLKESIPVTLKSGLSFTELLRTLTRQDAGVGKYDRGYCLATKGLDYVVGVTGAIVTCATLYAKGIAPVLFDNRDDAYSALSQIQERFAELYPCRFEDVAVHIINCARLSGALTITTVPTEEECVALMMKRFWPTDAGADSPRRMKNESGFVTSEVPEDVAEAVIKAASVQSPAYAMMNYIRAVGSDRAPQTADMWPASLVNAIHNVEEAVAELRLALVAELNELPEHRQAAQERKDILGVQNLAGEADLIRELLNKTKDAQGHKRILDLSMLKMLCQTAERSPMWNCNCRKSSDGSPVTARENALPFEPKFVLMSVGYYQVLNNNGELVGLWDLYSSKQCPAFYSSQEDAIKAKTLLGRGYRETPQVLVPMDIEDFGYCLRKALEEEGIFDLNPRDGLSAEEVLLRHFHVSWPKNPSSSLGRLRLE